MFAADVASYARLMSTDEVGTLRTLTAHRSVMDALIVQHGGRIANTAGDSVLAHFPSVVDAVECAIAVQDRLSGLNSGVPEDRLLRFRIGIHVGDVMVRGGDLLGDEVNVAARVQALADPGSVCISEDAYRQIAGKIHRAFEDWGEQQFKNIDRPVRVYAAGSAGVREIETKRLPLPEKPSIAVLPFANMSSDPEQEYLADGIVEEIISALSRVKAFFVISRNSTFAYKGRAVDPRQVSREVGVRYILDGSVRRSGNRLRIGAQLVDAATGAQVWTDRYDGEVSDIFALQDRVTEAVVGAIEPSITLSEIERARRKRPESLSAYDCVMRAFPAIWSQDTQTTEDGLRLAQKAMSLDPAYALPRALAGWCYAQRIAYLRTRDFEADRHNATVLARHAVDLDGTDPLVLTCAGAAYSITRNFELARSLIEKALSLDPNSAWAWNRSGWANVYTGQPDRAIEHFQRSTRLSPLDPMTFNVLFGVGVAHLHKGDYSQAVQWIEKSLREKPDAWWMNRVLSTAYFHAGQVDEARRAMATLLTRVPDLTVSKLLQSTPWNDFMREKISEAFRQMGLPD